VNFISKVIFVNLNGDSQYAHGFITCLQRKGNRIRKNQWNKKARLSSYIYLA